MIPDGLKIVFVAPCRYGMPGDIKTISYSTAHQLVIRGFAKEFKQEFLAALPPAPRHAFKVTALCPTFNRRDYLPTSISMFLAQTLKSSELLIIDDSYEKVEDLIPKHPRIRYVRLEPTVEPTLRGHDGRMLIGAKRNFGCSLAKGEFIIHWDDDDWNAPGRLEDQVRQIELSGRAVLTYHNILYWNEELKYACRAFPNKGIRAIHGATLCYRKTWWETHMFPPTGGGEDTDFGLKAMSLQQLHISDAQKFIVVRAHGMDDISTTARGNTCRTADHMCTPAIPKVSRLEMPPEFFLPLLKAVKMPEDAVIGAIKNYDWPAIRPYAVSLSRSGFCGAKLMFVENITEAARAGLSGEGFIVVDFVTPPDVVAEEQRDYLTFGRHRFKPVIDYIRQHRDRFRYLVWTDVRDLIFQSNPSMWLEANLNPFRVAAAGEGWLTKDEAYNNRWAKRVSPVDYLWLRDTQVCCSGSFAGESEAMLGIFERIYDMTMASRNVTPDNADQGMFNQIIKTPPYLDVTMVPLMRDGFAATWFPAKDNDLLLIPEFGKPVFDASDGIVYTPDTHIPFSIVHQFDRDPKWRNIMDKKYA
jgi:glycosyltransferase involved in cell wall biosynthesis